MFVIKTDFFMPQKQLISPHFAKRVNLNQAEMQELINKVVRAFDLGTLHSAEGIEVGYEDVNFFLTTAKGKFLLKILIDFTAKKPRSEADSRRYVDTMVSLRADGVPVPKLYKAGDDYLLKLMVPHNDEPIWMLVMEYFEGVDFINEKPTLKDIQVIAKILTKINSSKMIRRPMYDPWQPQFFMEEYHENEGLLEDANKKLLEEVVVKYQQIDLNKLPRAPIHADFMRNNLLRNKKGDYCVLDFGVVNLAPRIADLAVFLAGFCLDPEISLAENKLAYQTGLEEYSKYIALTDYEKEHLATMVQAAYGLFHIAATHEKKIEHNLTAENDYWIDLGMAGLKLTKEMGLYKKII